MPSVEILGWTMLFLNLVVMGCVERERLGIGSVGKGETGVGISGEEGEGRRVISSVGDGPGWDLGLMTEAGLKEELGLVW